MSTAKKPDLSGTQMAERVADVLVKRSESTGKSRFIEDALAIAGIIQAMLYGTLEALKHSGVMFGKCEAESGVPWITLVIFVGCVLPKTVGRATAGKAWEALATRIGGKS